MSNFEHAKYDADGVRIDDPSFNTQALRNDTSLVNGITFPGTNTVAINTNSVERLRVGNEGQTTILAASSSPALKVTQTGAGNAFVVEDSASTDSTPFVITSNGQVLLGTDTPLFSSNAGLQLASENASAPNSGIYSARFSTDGTGGIINVTKARGTKAAPSIVANTDALGTIQFNGYDGTNGLVAAAIVAAVDGTPGTNDMPGRLVFSTTADGASSPTEALRIDSTQSITNTAAGSGTNAYGFRVTSAKTGGTNNYAFSGEIAAGANRWNLYMAGSADNYIAGSLGIGAVSPATTKVYVAGTLPSSSAVSRAFSNNASTIPSTSTSEGCGYFSSLSTQDAAFALTDIKHYWCAQGTITGGSRTAPTNQYGFFVDSNLSGAANNYGFHSNIAAAANRWNLYMAGTARNYMSGKLNLGSITDAGTLHIKNTGNITFDGTSTFAGGTSGAQILYFNDNHVYYDNFVGDHVFRGASYASLFRVKQNGSVVVTKTVTAGGTTGAQTINKTVGSVNFAAGATTLVVTNSLADTASIIVATVATNDATMKSVLVVAAAGSFTLHANAAATAETRVNFCVFN